MAPLAGNILQDAFDEVVRRDPSFFQRQDVGFAPLPALVERFRASPLMSGASDSEIEQALVEGLAFFRERGVRAVEGEGPQARLSTLITDSIIDAFAADRGLTALAAPPRRAEPFAQVLAEDYDRRTTASGVDYVMRKTGARWLLIINAIGIPLGVWSRLLGDQGHDYRILVVESAGWDLVEGGQRAESDLATDTARIREVLDAEAVEQLDVIGWCSGGRVAAHLAAELPDRVQRLILASASLRGCEGSDVKATQFEEDIAGIFDSVARSPSSATFLSDLLMNSTKLAQPPLEDVMLFRLSSKEHAGALVAPLSNGEALKRYARRVGEDKTRATEGALAGVKCPILAIAGRYDHVVSNEHTWDVLNSHADGLTSAVISGAGHYAYDLQYPYFRALLDAFTQGQPFAAARVSALPLRA
jgi:pimeloyl-ACP methyl ester carboxylesterase